MQRMNFFRLVLFRRSSISLVFLMLLAVAVYTFASEAAEPVDNVVLWDTTGPLVDSAGPVDRSGWKAVPTDLLLLEADPPKASSDPGYYGRSYTFRGDVVVENRHFAAVFRSATGRVEILSKQTSSQDAEPKAAALGPKILEILPVEGAGTSAGRLELVRNAADQVVLNLSYGTRSSAFFDFGKSEIIAVKPAGELQRVILRSPIAYAVAPSFVGDDLIFNPSDYSTNRALFIPAENLFLGLLHGGSNELVMTWPAGHQRLSLQIGPAGDDKRLFQSVEFESDGQPFYAAPLYATGLWHREALEPAWLEKDVPLSWKRPFPAKWKTELYEGAVKTSYTFRQSRGQIWRGVPGSYEYPAWFEGEAALLHLSKKIPPKGDALIYFVEGDRTPPEISSPVDIVQATLGRPMCDSLLDVPGRQLRTHHRRGAEGVRRACTCGCTEAIQAVFEAGEEVARKQEISEDLQDMIYFVHRHVDRIDEYRRFAAELLEFLESSAKSSPGLRAYLEGLGQTARRIGEEYDVQKENMKSFAYADDLARQTLALTSKQDTNNVKVYMELLKAWRGMGGAQDYVVAQCHTIARKLAQDAGYGAVTDATAVPLARQIRARCRQALRNADGYEIWAEY